jgi:hypothetical protein
MVIFHSYVNVYQRVRGFSILIQPFWDTVDPSRGPAFALALAFGTSRSRSLDLERASPAPWRRMSCGKPTKSIIGQNSSLTYSISSDFNRVQYSSTEFKLT